MRAVIVYYLGEIEMKYLAEHRILTRTTSLDWNEIYFSKKTNYS